ncbi:hypothetical protein CC86DRAFT_373668 [Ophiobolus disseminans]|uniref:Uncharacterized protein n=1 Tax=Ophiobolus disseminans TaxID=1469910 RepID=A0A6A6ZLU5_9PLEO|nr:hypothetical protein CC86DRAFT_373668 [Ophiobolus disseminans]
MVLSGAVDPALFHLATVANTTLPSSIHPSLHSTVHRQQSHIYALHSSLSGDQKAPLPFALPSTIPPSRDARCCHTQPLGQRRIPSICFARRVEATDLVSGGAGIFCQRRDIAFGDAGGGGRRQVKNGTKLLFNGERGAQRTRRPDRVEWIFTAQKKQKENHESYDTTQKDRFPHHAIHQSSDNNTADAATARPVLQPVAQPIQSITPHCFIPCMSSFPYHYTGIAVTLASAHPPVTCPVTSQCVSSCG